MSNEGQPAYCKQYFNRVNPLHWSLVHFLENTEQTRPLGLPKDKVHLAYVAALRRIASAPAIEGEPVYRKRSDVEVALMTNPACKAAAKRFIAQELLKEINNKPKSGVDESMNTGDLLPLKRRRQLRKSLNSTIGCKQYLQELSTFS
jgi:hypothetical protein